MKLKYFSSKDNFGDFSKMDPGLLMRLDAWREYILTPVIVTCGTQGVHSTNSQHYLGKAVDVVVPGWTKPLLDLYFAAERFGFTGIGVYKDWSYGGRSIGGLHLDMREVGENVHNLKEARWIGVKEATGAQRYLPFDFSQLKRVGLI